MAGSKPAKNTQRGGGRQREDARGQDGQQQRLFFPKRIGPWFSIRLKRFPAVALAHARAQRPPIAEKIAFASSITIQLNRSNASWSGRRTGRRPDRINAGPGFRPEV